ncbi:MAG: 2-amino-4-hydroxy-6-hydroxymethyldihydropteridine diphosphokinase [Anaerolineae bacterium]|jgi:2-amino-4-hydroxy-6-hydroxymethyldihydropteridine diphosphokinase|nr:2-amino-4-hydroxy-6-hydroxymethyldihydropteridine diphosphokinase [Anaerolineae bacterium]
MDIIEIDALRLRCIIGFSAHELKDQQDVVISLRLGTDMRRGAITDQPNDVLNYRTITKAIIAHVEHSRYQLVEALASAIARICVVDHAASWVQVRVHKPGALRFSDSVGVLIERTRADFEPTIAYVSIGSNIDPANNLSKAIALLGEQCKILALSQTYQSPPYGFPDQADFWDITAKVQTMLTPVAFKQSILDPIELACGRDRASQLSKDGPLALDMDILLWGETAFEYGIKPWRVPNKGILKYAAVAIPLAEIAPEVIHPDEGITLAAIVARFPLAEREQVRLVPFTPI